MPRLISFLINNTSPKPGPNAGPVEVHIERYFHLC
jgi:hypothetical protein